MPGRLGKLSRLSFAQIRYLSDEGRIRLVTSGLLKQINVSNVAGRTGSEAMLFDPQSKVISKVGRAGSDVRLFDLQTSVLRKEGKIGQLSMEL